MSPLICLNRVPRIASLPRKDLQEKSPAIRAAQVKKYSEQAERCMFKARSLINLFTLPLTRSIFDFYSTGQFGFCLERASGFIPI
jgi:hypothetical protein